MYEAVIQLAAPPKPGLWQNVKQHFEMQVYTLTSVETYDWRETDVDM